MGILARLISKDSTPKVGADPKEATLLAQLLQVIGTIDGKMDSTEKAIVDAFSQTLPQLKERKLSAEKGTRQGLLAELSKVNSLPFRKQCFTIAVEVALASGHINDSEDQYIEHLRDALRIDDAFAQQTIEITAAKYGFLV